MRTGRKQKRPSKATDLVLAKMSWFPLFRDREHCTAASFGFDASHPKSFRACRSKEWASQKHCISHMLKAEKHSIRVLLSGRTGHPSHHRAIPLQNLEALDVSIVDLSTVAMWFAQHIWCVLLAPVLAIRMAGPTLKEAVASAPAGLKLGEARGWISIKPPLTSLTSLWTPYGPIISHHLPLSTSMMDNSINHRDD